MMKRTTNVFEACLDWDWLPTDADATCWREVLGVDGSPLEMWGRGEHVRLAVAALSLDQPDGRMPPVVELLMGEYHYHLVGAAKPGSPVPWVSPTRAYIADLFYGCALAIVLESLLVRDALKSLQDGRGDKVGADCA
jgi:hypothetical protein